jgi:hypothetical protein
MSSHINVARNMLGVQRSPTNSNISGSEGERHSCPRHGTRIRTQTPIVTFVMPCYEIERPCSSLQTNGTINMVAPVDNMTTDIRLEVLAITKILARGTIRQYENRTFRRQTGEPKFGRVMRRPGTRRQSGRIHVYIITPTPDPPYADAGCYLESSCWRSRNRGDKSHSFFQCREGVGTRKVPVKEVLASL